MISSARLILELQYWFNNIVVNHIPNKYLIDYPMQIPESAMIDNSSFITLIFKEDYNIPVYSYKYDENTVRSTWPFYIQKRLLVYSNLAKYYYLSDSTTSINFFNLQGDDISLLDSLLYYRLNNTLTINTDTTTTTYVTGIINSNLNILTTSLSKLIFTYLDFKINNNIGYYNNTTLISSSTSPLESLYEIYLANEMYKYISNKGL